VSGEETYEYWREYPDHDPQSVVWYPLTYGPLDIEEVWPPNGSPHKPETSFYLHVPFCAVVSPFCPFNKYAWRDKQAQDFVTAVKREISLLTNRPSYTGSRVRAGFLGGGTPTALSGEQLCEIIEHFQKQLVFSDST